MSKNTRNRILLTAVAALLLVVMSVGGTVAWLLDKTDPVTNTFTTAGIDIDLTETWNTASTEGGPLDSWTAKLVPGNSYDKNPIVSVVRPTTDVDIYLFVEFTEANAPSTYLTYTSTLTAANGWAQGDGTNIPNNVWYRTVTATSTETNCTGESTDDCAAYGTVHWHLLDGDTIAVKDTVTTANMATAATASLTYKAYAVQVANLTAQQAWANRAQ